MKRRILTTLLAVVLLLALLPVWGAPEAQAFARATPSADKLSDIYYNSANGHFYQFIDQNLSQSNARTYCTERGGYLLRIDDVSEWTYLNKNVFSGSLCFTFVYDGPNSTGGYYRNQTNTYFGNEATFISKTSADSNGSGFICEWDFGTKRPEDLTFNSGEWTQRFNTTLTTAEQVSYFCNSMGGALSGSLSSGSFTCRWSPTGSDYNDTANGKQYSIFRGWVTWTRAEAMCEAAGGHLPVLLTRSEWDNMLNAVKTDGLNHYWLGGLVTNDIYAAQSNKTWGWVTGETWNKPSGTTTNPPRPWTAAMTPSNLWMANEPNNNYGNYGRVGESYLELKDRTAWNDLGNEAHGVDTSGVHNSFGFICQWDHPTEPLCAGFTALPSSAVAGADITIEAEIIQGGNVTFTWNIFGASGITYESPDGYGATGSFSMADGRKTLSATFIMPTNDMTVALSLTNGAQTIPLSGEIDLVTGTHNTGLFTLLNPTPTIELFNALSAQYYPFIPNTLSASFGRECTGATENSLEFKYEPEDLFDLTYDNSNLNKSPIKDIEITPIATLRRTAFGDDPNNPDYPIYLNNESIPGKPLFKTLPDKYTISAAGTASNSYITYCREDCPGHTCNTTVAFTPHLAEWTFKCNIYNGMETLPSASVEDDADDTDVDPGGDDDDTFGDDPTPDEEWTNDDDENTIEFDWNCGISGEIAVYRLMYDYDVNGDVIGGAIEVPGQYPRSGSLSNNIDVWKNHATITWAVVQPQEKVYESDINIASAHGNTYGKSQDMYSQAVFATDKYLWDNQGKSNPDFHPIKSGYFFNPGGQYTCTIKTTRYVTDYTDRLEHNQIVRKAIKSFAYVSPLTYKMKKADGIEEIYRLNNLNVATASLADDFFELNQSILTYEIDPALPTHVDVEDASYMMTALLEGYSASRTLDSYNNYQYREYPGSPGQTDAFRLYKVTEMTKVTLIIGPKEEGRKLYTWVNMKNRQEANIEVLIRDFWYQGDFDTKPVEIKGLKLDKFALSVCGSLIDDIRDRETMG